jgi:hypothetical protein
MRIYHLSVSNTEDNHHGNRPTEVRSPNPETIFQAADAFITWTPGEFPTGSDPYVFRKASRLEDLHRKKDKQLTLQCPNEMTITVTYEDL